jgi:HAE1 family hydrophobic/amphiphilic exporter-1
MVTMPVKDLQSFDDPLEHLENMRKKLKKNFEKDGLTIAVHAQKDGPPTGKEINVRVVGVELT